MSNARKVAHCHARKLLIVGTGDAAVILVGVDDELYLVILVMVMKRRTTSRINVNELQ